MLHHFAESFSEHGSEGLIFIAKIEIKGTYRDTRFFSDFSNARIMIAA
ncbi:hypothetical protein KTH_45300 [Thermosporothrix hazakensis]|nr:hypothetical protein KTH_45300 [Thermosporothrix hazakensis]